MARRGSGVEVQATIKDDASAGVRKVANAIAAEAEKIAKSDQKLAKTAAEARKAKNMQLTASQKLKLAMEKEAAAGDPVATKLAELNEQYTIATRKASAFAKAGEEIPKELLEQATAAKKATEAIIDLQLAKLAQAKADEIAAKEAEKLADKLKEQKKEAEENEPKVASLREQINALEGSYAAAGIAIAAAATAAVAGTIHLTTSTAELGDKIAKSSRSIGLSTTAYQGFDHAMQVSGTSIDEQSSALAEVNKKIREAAEGVGTGSESFKRLGIDVKDSSGNIKSSEKVMLEIADAFKELPDGVEKSAASLDLFGGSGAAMTEFLNLGSTGINELTQEAQDLGIVMGADALTASEQFNDSLGRFTKVAGATQSQLGQLLVKAFTPMLDHFTDLQKKSKTGVDSLKGFVKGLISFGAGALMLFQNIGSRIGNVFRGLQVIGSTALLGIASAIDLAAKGASHFLNKLNPVLDGLVSLGLLDSNPIRGFTEAVTTATGDMKAGIQDNIDQTVQAMTDAEDSAANMSEGLANMAGDMLHAVDSMTLEITPAVDASTDAHNREFNAINKTGEALKKKVAAQKEAAKASALAAKRAKEREQAEIKLQNENLKKGQELVNMYAGPVSNAFGAFSANIEDLGTAFKEMAKSALTSIINFVEKAILAYAAESAAAAFSSQASIPFVGPVLGGIAATAAFATIKGLLNKFNKGGIVGGTGNQDTELGLLTPGELIIPANLTRALLQVAGAPAPAAAAAGGVVQSGGGAGVTVNFNENVLAPRSAGQLDRFVADQLMPSLGRLKRRGYAI